MKDNTVSTTGEQKPVTAEKQSFKIKLPAKITFKKDVMVKFAIGFVIALAIVPAIDWVVQTSITSQYVAFYKDSDVSRNAYLKELERQYGDQVVNEMLAKAAIAQAAKDRDIKVSDADVDKAIETDKAKAGITSDEDFNKALQQNGITATDYRAYVKVTVTLDKLLEGTVSEPTDKEISDYFAQNKDLFTGKKLEDVKSQISTDLKTTALNSKRQDWISKALTGYNPSNTLVSKTNKEYKFLKSISLIQRLFSNDTTK